MRYPRFAGRYAKEMSLKRSDAPWVNGRVVSEPASQRPRILSLLVHSIGLVLFAVLVVRFWPGIRKTWTEIHWDLFGLSCALVPVMMSFKVQRFRLLSRTMVGALSYRFTYLVYFAAYFIGVITPGRIGEFAKVHYLMSKKGVSAAQALRPTLVDRLLDMLCLVAVGAVGWAALGLYRIGGVASAKIAGFVALGVAALTGPIWGRAVIRALGRRATFGVRAARTMVWLEETLAAFYTRIGAQCSLLTIAAYTIGFFQAWLIARSVGIHEIPYHSMCVIMAAISLAMLVPISVSGFGTREASAIFLMGKMYGIPEDRAIGFSLLYFAVFNVFGGLVGLVCWLAMPFYRRKGLKHLANLKAEENGTE